MRKKTVLLAVCSAMLVFLFLSGCGNGEPETAVDVDETEFDGELFFTGSSTLAPTISQIADTFQNEYGTWDQVDDSLPAEEIRINVSTGGSGVGAKAVIENTAHFGMLAREARDEEIDEIADYKEYMLGIDALLVAVNKDNALGQKRDDLTKEEIRSIFSEEVASWSEFNPDLGDEEVILLVRDVGGGAHGVFQNAIMGDVEVSVDAIEVPSMTGLVERLAGNALAIGYASYGIAEQHQEDLVAFKVDGIEPSAENILDGTYPIARPLVLVRSGELSAAEEAFLNYIKSETGSDIISEMGFLPAI